MVLLAPLISKKEGPPLPKILYAMSISPTRIFFTGISHMVSEFVILLLLLLLSLILIWLTVNKVCSTKVLLGITRSEKIMLVSNEEAFSLIFLIPNIYRTRGKAGDDKV